MGFKGLISMIKVIKTIEDYEIALENIEKLMESNPKPGTPDAHKLELLVLLIKDYEDKNYTISVPGPIDAIKFRMDQLKLRQRDLIPFIGSKSKVSEILSEKRPLTLNMIRALNNGLGIPIKALVQEQKPAELNKKENFWKLFPIKEMVKLYWINDIKGKEEEKVLEDFFSPLGSIDTLKALYKKTNNVRTARPVDKYALTAWTARIMMRGLKNPYYGSYRKGLVTEAFIKELILLSPKDCGPKLAYDFLIKNGIILVIEPHLKGTHLDGVSLMAEKGPIIGLSLRHDRIDNFWFCLIHEMAHIFLHFNDGEVDSFFDDLDIESDNPLEKEADNFSAEILIPKKVWEYSPAKNLRTPEAALNLAEKLKIHPAIAAGKMRHYFNSYYILNNLVGRGEVRKCFSEIKWR